MDLRNILYGAAMGVGLLAGACKDVRTEKSAVLHEDAVVAARIYTPSTHDTQIGFKAFNMVGSGAGSLSMDYDGNMGVGIGNGLQISSVTVPENYGVLFQCQHGNFTSQGPDARHQILYQQLHDGQKVDVLYQEIYQATYDDTNDDGKKELLERVLVDFDFLDAQPKQEAKENSPPEQF